MRTWTESTKQTLYIYSTRRIGFIISHVINGRTRSITFNIEIYIIYIYIQIYVDLRIIFINKPEIFTLTLRWPIVSAPYSSSLRLCSRAGTSYKSPSKEIPSSPNKKTRWQFLECLYSNGYARNYVHILLNYSYSRFHRDKRSMLW